MQKKIIVCITAVALVLLSGCGQNDTTLVTKTKVSKTPTTSAPSDNNPGGLCSNAKYKTELSSSGFGKLINAKLVGLDFESQENLWSKEGNDINTLSDLTCLEFLHIMEMQKDFDTLSALLGMNKLKVLWMDTPLLNFDTATGMPATQIKDASAISKLSTLIDLSLSGYRIGIFPSLAGLSNLKYLTLTNMYGIKGTSFLSGVKNLEELYLQDDDLSDLSGISKLKNLKNLTITGVAGASYKSLRPTQFDDISPLENLSNLELLNLSGTESAGETLKCQTENDEGKLSNLESLSGLVKLKKLTIACQPVSNLSSIANLVNLEELDLTAPTYDITAKERGSFGKVSNLASLSGLKKLKKLILTGQPIKDISPLADIKSLEEIVLSNTKVTDFSPLYSRPNLKKIDAYGALDLGGKCNKLMAGSSEARKCVDDSYVKCTELKAKFPAGVFNCLN